MSAVKKPFKKAVPPEVIAVWDENYMTVIDSIRDGQLDKHIKEIAQACIARFEEVNGISLVKKSNGGSVSRSAAYAAAAAATDAQPIQMLAFNSVAPAHNVVVGAFVYAGKAYRKSDVMDKVITLDGSYGHGEYDGLRVRITGAGKKMLKVDFIDPPPAGSGMANKIAKSMPCFVNYEQLQPYLRKN